MRRSRAGWMFFVVLLALTGSAGRAAGQGAWGNGPVPGSQQSEKHNPNSPNYADFSRGYSQDQYRRTFPGPAAPPARVTSGSNGHVTSSGPTLIVSPYGYGLYPYYYPYALGTDSGYFGPYIAPPVVISGDAQFGPQAAQRFLGVDPVPGKAAQPAVRPRHGLDADVAPVVPHADSRARLKAWNLIDQGDAEFAQRHFAQALSRYRDAVASARDMAEAQFRQGFALVAMARYPDAAKAWRRGLLLEPDWANSNFRLDDLYGENKVVKDGHLDALRKAIAIHPHDPDLLFVLGVCLFFDDQPAAAAPLLRRAANVLGPADIDPLTGFLKQLPPEPRAAPRGANDKAAANPLDRKIPPPPLPAPDPPGDKKPVEKPFDPFEGLDAGH